MLPVRHVYLHTWALQQQHDTGALACMYMLTTSQRARCRCYSIIPAFLPVRARTPDWCVGLPVDFSRALILHALHATNTWALPCLYMCSSVRSSLLC